MLRRNYLYVAFVGPNDPIPISACPVGALLRPFKPRINVSWLEQGALTGNAAPQAGFFKSSANCRRRNWWTLAIVQAGSELRRRQSAVFEAAPHQSSILSGRCRSISTWNFSVLVAAGLLEPLKSILYPLPGYAELASDLHLGHALSRENFNFGSTRGAQTCFWHF